MCIEIIDLTFFTMSKMRPNVRLGVHIMFFNVVKGGRRRSIHTNCQESLWEEAAENV